MKVLFCSNTFFHTNHGPAKFAQFALEINSINENIELRVASEDIIEGDDNIYKVDLFWSRIFRPISMLVRNFDYYIAVKKIRKEYDFDILVFNNAIVGLWSKIKFRKSLKVVGFINDENNLSYRFYSLKPNWYNLRRGVFRVLEKYSVKRLDYIIANSEYLRNAIYKEYKAARDKVGLVYKGVDIAKFPKHKKKRINNSGPIRVLFVKSDPIIGGLRFLIEALENLEGFPVI